MDLFGYTWRSQLWLIEVEWKEGSNFFEQSRAFARGKINSEKLFQELRICLKEYENVLNEINPGYKEGHIVENIIKKTIKNHINNDYLTPHGWVILGHDGNNIEKLRNDYERELQARFTNQQYILSMTRMFQNDLSTYLLLEQYSSPRCREFISIDTSILVKAVSGLPVSLKNDLSKESPEAKDYIIKKRKQKETKKAKMKDFSFLEGLNLNHTEDLKRKFGYYLDPKRKKVGKKWEKLTQKEKIEITKQLDEEFEQLPDKSGFGAYVDNIVKQYV